MGVTVVAIHCILLIVVLNSNVSNGLNLGLIAGDNKRLGSPLTIKKYSHKSPIFININQKPSLPLLPKLPKAPPTLAASLRKLKSPLPLPKLPKPPPSLSSSLRKLRSLSSPLLPKPLLLSPLIPRLPLFPLLPPISPLHLPILPPLLPVLPLLPPPLLPPPILPLVPRLRLSPLLPLKVPILKTPLQKALGSELKPIALPCPENKKDLLERLKELKKQGSLTVAEFARFKKILLRKR